MAHRRMLTQAQFDLVQRIADCPPEAGAMGSSGRVSAAERRRGLVKTFERGSSKRVEITMAGREYLVRSYSRAGSWR